MILAVRQLIKQGGSSGEIKFNSWMSAGILLIAPWILFSIFAGMGPPPITISGWLATSTEQVIRYTILIVGGIIALTGFSLLKSNLIRRGDNTYSILAFTLLQVAIPLYIINMAFWGYYLTSVFRFFVTLPNDNRPEWYPPIKMFFYIISVIEVALIYLSTVLFAISLKKTGILSNRATRWYIILGTLGIILVSLPPSLPEPLATLSYLAAIPAIPFIMPYLMGVRSLHFNVTMDL